jgi:hypothetical protein
MNGFSLLAEAYRKNNQAHEAHLMDFLSECKEDDFYKLFDSSAFNEICMSYVRRAVKELVNEETITDDQAVAVRNRVSVLFSEVTAKDICQN